MQKITRKFGLKKVMGSTPIEIVSEWPVQYVCVTDRKMSFSYMTIGCMIINHMIYYLISLQV